MGGLSQPRVPRVDLRGLSTSPVEVAAEEPFAIKGFACTFLREASKLKLSSETMHSLLKVNFSDYRESVGVLPLGGSAGLPESAATFDPDPHT